MKKIKYWVLLLIIAFMCFSVACKKKPKSVENDPTEGKEEEVIIIDEEDNEEEEVEDTDDNLVGVNYVENGDFSLGVENWDTFITGGGDAEFTVNDGVGKVDIKSTGNLDYSVQLFYDGFPLKNGGVYEFAFDMASTIPRSIQARIQLNGGDYRAYIEEDLDITEEMQTYTYTFEMSVADPIPRLCFNMGTPKEGSPYDAHIVTLDNVSVKLLDASKIVEEIEVDLSVDCNTNQVGFLPNARKTVVIRSENPGTEFNIVDNNKKVVFTGVLSGAINSENAGETVYQGDFTEFTTPGTYYVVSKDGQESYPFTIADNVYDDLLIYSFKMLYLQRCGMELTSNLAGDFAHPVCHTKEAIIYGTDKKKDVSGGWHDAGDYGRYVVTGVQTVQDLILTYEDFPEIWDGKDADKMGIPESGNGIPDILDEVKYELDWLLKMQDENSGGVYHKVTCKEFPGFVMPEGETNDLYLSPISTTATGGFAAVMAKSSQVYKKIDPAFADKCLAAAEKAWGYLEVTENKTGFHNPKDILTGEYGDAQDEDERFWASVELYKVTKKKAYNKYIEKAFTKDILQGYGWADMGTFGAVAYLTMDKSLQKEAYVKKVKDAIIEKADEMLGYAKADGYNSSLESYYWGSNLGVCNNARQFLLASELTGKEEYNIYAYDQLQYLLGQNALSYCFISEYGGNSPKHSHHRPSMATNEVMKGMLVGGPNSALEDPVAKELLAGVAPAKCYLDNDQSYSTNEVTIYWNSPFVYLLSSQMK